ncbi:hypothetical protein D3C86_1950620 [compost metagenome]
MCAERTINISACTLHITVSFEQNDMSRMCSDLNSIDRYLNEFLCAFQAPVSILPSMSKPVCEHVPLLRYIIVGSITNASKYNVLSYFRS